MTRSRAITAVVVAVGLLVPTGLAGVALAQAGPQPTVQVPTLDIIPEPDSGESPDEAGDRGGALQLAMLGLVVVAIVGGGFHLRRQSRRARADAGTP